VSGPELDAPATPESSASPHASLDALVAELERTSNSDPAACLVAGVQAMAAAEGAGAAAARMQISYFVGFAHYLLSHDDEAMSAMERALELARALEDRSWEARIIGGLGAVHSSFGDNDSAIELLEQSLAIRREIGDAYGIASSLNNLGVTFEEMGSFPERARELLLEANAMFVDLGSDHGQAASLCHLTLLDLSECDQLAPTDPQAARLVAQHALRTAEAACHHAQRLGDNLRLLGEVMVQRARALIACGHTDEAEQVLAELDVLDTTVGTTHLSLGVASARGRLHRARGELDLAVQQIERALLQGDHLVRAFEQVGLLGELVAIHEQRGALADALSAHRRLLAATLEQRDDAAERRGRALNARLDVERAQVAAAVERLRSQRLELANRELTYAATHDGLTGLANRRSFDATLAARTPDPRAALTCVLGDLDHFKEINDRFSHPVGDEVLRRLGRIIGAAVRGTDLVARIGGEEIAVLLADGDGGHAPDRHHRSVAEVCERIRSSIAEHPWDEITVGLRVTISIGAATRRPGESATHLVARADALLYAAKAAGRDTVQIDTDVSGTDIGDP
jgi:diguanylate cyclase (GGDEF)-like protein